MVTELRADMATQLAHVREMEQRGELVFPGESAQQSLSGVAKPPRNSP